MLNRVLKSRRNLSTFLVFFLIFGFTFGVVVRFATAQWPRVVFGNDYDWVFPRVFYPSLEVARAPWLDQFNRGQRAIGFDFAATYLVSNAPNVGLTYYDCAIDNVCRMPGDARPPSSPPVFNFFSQHVFLKFAFGHALILNSILQVVLFIGASIWILLGIKKNILIPYLILALFGLFFLTPIGLTVHERGQLDGYPAAGIALVIAGVINPSLSMVIVGGLLASIKWSSLPFLAVFCSTVLAFDFRKYWKLTVSAGVAFWVPFLIFPHLWSGYFKMLREYEMMQPGPLSFGTFLPSPFSKLIILFPAVILISLGKKQRNRTLDAHLIFWFATSLLFVVVPFPNVVYEYRAILLLSIFPNLIVWINGRFGESRSGPWVTAGLTLMILLTMRCYPLERTEKLMSETLSKGYLLASILAAGYLLMTRGKVNRIEDQIGSKDFRFQ